MPTSRFFGRPLTTMSWAVLALILQMAVSAQAQTYTDLHDFNASAGDPYNFQLTKLAQGRDGNFYGEAVSGGTGQRYDREDDAERSRLDSVELRWNRWVESAGRDDTR